MNDDAEKFLRMRIEILEEVVRDLLTDLQNFQSLNGIRQYAYERAEAFREATNEYNKEVLESAGLPTTR